MKNKHCLAVFPEIDGSELSDSAMTLCRFFRNTSVANDITERVFLLEIDFHYLRDRFGIYQ